ncbi:MAG: response regulator [Oscillospiraceae bacterium]
MKLLIVDDQMDVAQGLKQGVNWGAMGFTEVQVAYNALDARTSLQKKIADVMLCDIEMPMENGLELVAWMREKGMKTRCIFLTAHAKFSYAQEALKLGGFDYITQPASYAEISRAVAKAVEDMHSNYDQDQLEQKGRAFHQQQPAIVANVLRGFLNAQRNERDVTTLEKLGILPLRGKAGYLVLLQAIRWLEGAETWEGSLLAVALGNIAKEIFEPHSELSVISYMMGDDYCYAMVLQNTEGEEMPLESVVRQLMFLRSVCEQFLHCHIACYLDGPLLVDDMPECWRSLKEMCADNVSLREGVFQREEKRRVPHSFRVPQIRSWHGLLRDGYTDAVEKEGTELLDTLSEEGRLDAETLRAFYQDFMQMVYHSLEGNEEKIHNLFHTPEDFEVYRNGMKSIENMKRLIHLVMQGLEAKTGPMDQKSLVAEIVRYINDHLSNELWRDDIAAHVNLSADYMTRIFKKEMGLTIKEYIIQQKMQTAKTLLLTTNLPVSFIAAKVGYCSFSHFSYTYKKEIGNTPQDERKSKESEKG